MLTPLPKCPYFPPYPSNTSLLPHFRINRVRMNFSLLSSILNFPFWYLSDVSQNFLSYPSNWKWTILTSLWPPVVLVMTRNLLIKLSLEVFVKSCLHGITVVNTSSILNNHHYIHDFEYRKYSISSQLIIKIL